jgi:hypothetical protein
MNKPVWPLVVTYLIGFAIAIPWYWQEGYRETVLGLPRWVVVSIGASVFISTLTAWVMVRRWPVEDEEEEE